MKVINIMRKLDQISKLHFEVSGWVQDRVSDKGKYLRITA